ncbi:unnamed protein product [Spirodela intermedia]|uniref:Uncharacterized protein n=1 Tax=Spirodela intermedia TaxID=51605 RepID=A0A7I8KCM8_SPIIN|nr:unnamed protein product [Spirodela intermedia]
MPKSPRWASMSASRSTLLGLRSQCTTAGEHPCQLSRLPLGISGRTMALKSRLEQGGADRGRDLAGEVVAGEAEIFQHLQPSDGVGDGAGEQVAGEVGEPADGGGDPSG